MFPAPGHLGGPLLCPLYLINISLVCGGVWKPGDNIPDVVSQVLKEGEQSLPSPTGYTPAGTAALLAALSQAWLALTVALLPSWPLPSAPVGQQSLGPLPPPGLLPRCRILHLSFPKVQEPVDTEPQAHLLPVVCFWQTQVHSLSFSSLLVRSPHP